MTNNDKGSITLTMKSAPFMDDPPDADAYYAALGRAMFLWGRFENHLNSVLMVIGNIPGGEDLLREFPLSWKRKAATWRKAFNSIAVLQQWRTPALELITDATDAAQDRHKLFHGDWGQFTSTDPLTAQLMTMQHKGDRVLIKTYNVSVDLLGAFAEAADRLNTRLVPYLWNLSRLQPTLQNRTTSA